MVQDDIWRNFNRGGNSPTEYTVSELSNKLKSFVEKEFGYVRLKGELSRITVAKSGHLYTDLKDDSSVINAICWSRTVDSLSVTPEEGLEVICTGRLTTYPGRSNYQIIIETMEIAGEGALLKMLEDRRKKLLAEGLFDDKHKKQIPYIPSKIGVITSPTGAVIKDIMHRLRERFPSHVLLYPVVVQGEDAANQVSTAIDNFNKLDIDSEYRPDVIIVARGGGSLEDLMPFNEEIVVRSVFNSEIPIISAIGHETDTTLIDYASDIRAPTPTGAAEYAVPVRIDLISTVKDYDYRLNIAINRMISDSSLKIESLSRGLGEPTRILDNNLQKLDNLSIRLEHSLSQWINKKESRLRELSAGINPKEVEQEIRSYQFMISNISGRFIHAQKTSINKRFDHLNATSRLLDSLSFKRVLKRGFSLITDTMGNTLTSASDVNVGQHIMIRMRDGAYKATVDREASISNLWGKKNKLEVEDEKKNYKFLKKEEKQFKKDDKRLKPKNKDQGSLF